MKVILLKDIPGTGRRHDVKDVASGYAGNFLLPKKLAVLATPTTLIKLESDKKKVGAESKLNEDLTLKNLTELSGKTISLKEKANEEGHLFAGVRKEEIVKMLKMQLRIDLLPEHLVLDKPIKEIGTQTLEASAYNKTVSFTITIERV